MLSLAQQHATSYTTPGDATDANRTVVQYALHGTTSPMAVSRYDLLPPEEQRALPSAAALTEAVTRPVTVDGRQMTLAEGLELLRMDGQDTEPS